MARNAAACTFITAVLFTSSFLPPSSSFLLPLKPTTFANARLGLALQPRSTCRTMRTTMSGSNGGLWTPDQEPTGLWTPQGEIAIESEQTKKEEERPLLEAEWEIMFGQSPELRVLARSGQLMEEISKEGEDLAGVNVTEIGLRSFGDDVNVELAFEEFKALLAKESFCPATAMPTSRLISTCYRRGGKQSWMEALGALQVMGFNPDDFIKREGPSKLVYLDVACLQLAGMMGMEEAKLDNGDYSEEELIGVRNLAIGMTRVLLRYALLEEVLKRQPKAGGFHLVVTARAAAFMDKEDVLLPEGADQNILRSDFEPSLEWEEIDATVGGKEGKALFISNKQVDAWVAQELGMEAGPSIITSP